MENNENYKENYIEGRQPVIEALRADNKQITIDKLFILKDCMDGPINTIVKEAKKQNIIINFVSKDRLNQISVGKKHQGVIAICAAYPYSTIEEILQNPKTSDKNSLILVLDNIEDPMNLGGIIRTANTANAAGVIIHNRHATLLSPSAIKASAGAVSHTLVAKHNNIGTAIEVLKKNGYWCVAGSMDGTDMYDIDLTGKIALVIGNEGKGISRLVKEKCDFTAKIPMNGEIQSLNASVAAGILMYEIIRQRKYKK